MKLYSNVHGKDAASVTRHVLKSHNTFEMHILGNYQ